MRKEYKVGNKVFPVGLGQDDHDALDKAIWHANDTWQDVYDENDKPQIKVVEISKMFVDRAETWAK